VSGEILPQHAIDHLLKDKNYTLAQQLLERYPSARTDLLKQIKTKTDRIADLPETFEPKDLPAKAVAPQKPMPDSPDIQAMKAKVIKDKGEALGLFKGRGMFIDTGATVAALAGHPMALAPVIARTALGKVMVANAKKGGWMTRSTPAEENMIKSTKVYSSKKAALAARKP
jgi:hypothetical protein